MVKLSAAKRRDRRDLEPRQQGDTAGQQGTHTWHLQSSQTHAHTHTVTHTCKHARQFSSVAQSYPTLCHPMDCTLQSSLSITNCQSLLKLMFIESVMPSNHLILCRPLLLLPSIFPSIRVFSNESVPLYQVAKVLEFQL